MIWRTLHEYVNFVHGPEKQYRSLLPYYRVQALFYVRCEEKGEDLFGHSCSEAIESALTVPSAEEGGADRRLDRLRSLVVGLDQVERRLHVAQPLH
eukprot:COSAG05_NODE_623_length_8291_cov_4.353394_6_plen_96_part_00